MIDPPRWSLDQLKNARDRAEDGFREARHTEPLEVYLEQFDENQGIVEEVIEQTVDLTRLDEYVLDLMSDSQRREVLRYLTGPPVSEDDLKVLMNVSSLSSKALRESSDLVSDLATFIRDWHDRRRFPWLGGEGREPEEHERQAAVLATTALIAMRRTETWRRNASRRAQERRVKQRLKRAGYRSVKAKIVATHADLPDAGKFYRETKLGTRKADFVIGLWDRRVLALECKVSNSALNSVKRLNNDAAVKAEVWRDEFGSASVVPAAVLSGVYKLEHLNDAQTRGLTIFWSHDLQAMTRWINATKKG